MDYQSIITKVAKALDPEETISVSIVNDTDLSEAHFVIADIDYSGKTTMRVPFIIYNDESVFMPLDWQSELPKTADNIEDTEWVTFPNGRRAVMLNGLPRLFAGDF